MNKKYVYKDGTAYTKENYKLLKQRKAEKKQARKKVERKKKWFRPAFYIQNFSEYNNDYIVGVNLGTVKQRHNERDYGIMLMAGIWTIIIGITAHIESEGKDGN